MNLNKLQILTVLCIIFAVISSCNKLKDIPQNYQNQIGDTPFNRELDDVNFKFCDSANTLHKRAYVRYAGGMKALKNELIKNYNLQSKYKSYNGYFVIRFVVNCNDNAGRFRMESLDSNFNLANPPKALKEHIFTIFKALKNWQHPFYDGKDYDGYKFVTIKIINGQIEII